MADGSLIALRMRLTGGKQVAAESETAAKGIGKTTAATEKANATASAGAKKAAKLATSLKKTGRVLSTYVSLPIIGVGVAAGVMALNFDRSMRNVNSIAQLPEKQFNSLKQSVLDLAGPTAQAPKTLAEGMYDLVSSGFNAKEALVIIKQSALAASAGLTTTDVSTKAVAAALNSYHLPASKAAAVTDTLFETVNRGVVTFPELATTIGDVLPFASQLGVTLNQVGAAYSTMTKEGLSGAESATRIKNVLVTLIKPGKDLSTALDKIGMSGEELTKKYGLQGAIEKVVGTTKGKKEEIAALFPNIRALGGVLSLVGKNAKYAREDVHALESTAGAKLKVLHQQEKSFGFQLQRAWAELQVVLIELGEDLLPIVVPFLLELAHAGASAVAWFAELPEPLQHVGLALLGIAVLAGPMMMVVGSVIEFGIALAAIGVTAAGIGIALGFVTAIIALGAAFYFAYHEIKPFHDAVDAVVGALGGLGNTIAYFLTALTPVGAVITLVVTHFGWLKNAVHNVERFFSTLPSRVSGAIHNLPHLIATVVAKVVVFMALLPIRIPIFITQMGIRLVKALIGIAPKAAHAAVRIAVSIAHGIASGASAIWAWVRTLPGKFAAAVASIAGALAGVGADIAKQIASGLKNELLSILPGPVKNALEGAAGIAGDVGGFIGGAIPGNAGGTEYWRGGVTLVGERGPEIVNLPRGSEVITAPQTHAILSGRERTAVSAPLSAPRTRQMMNEPRAAAAATQARGGGRSYLLPLVVKVGAKTLAETVAEVTQDAEARL